MEVINTSCAAVAVDMVEMEPPQRACRVTAKVTLQIHPNGAAELVSEDPAPVLDRDEVTALGIRPRDRGGIDVVEHVEVFVNAIAHAPNGVATDAMEVSLQLGEVTHFMHVFGDREWIGWGPDAQIGPAQPFVRMPLTFGRAFGGSPEIWIDQHSPVDVPHPQNPHGLGVDPEALAEQLAEQLGAPESYPRFERRRRLPNLENPTERIMSWGDRPLPHCWAACPADAAGAVDLTEIASQSLPVDGAQSMAPPWAGELATSVVRRSHPALGLPAEPAGLPIVLRGVLAGGEETFHFRLPPVAVELDYAIDGRTGTRRCRLRRVLMEPEERRVMLTFEDKFQYVYLEDSERSLRVRVTGDEG